MLCAMQLVMQMRTNPSHIQFLLLSKAAAAILLAGVGHACGDAH